MKALYEDDHKKFKFYDKVITESVQQIVNCMKTDEETNTGKIAFKYDGGIDTKFIFQCAKIINVSLPMEFIFYVEAPRKLFNQLKRENPDYVFKRINYFSKQNFVFIMKPSFIKSAIRSKFRKNELYTPDIITEIWRDYYEKDEREEGFDELEDLL